MQQWVCTGTGFSASIICVIVPVIIGAQVRGMLFQAGGGISGGALAGAALQVAGQPRLLPAGEARVLNGP